MSFSATIVKFLEGKIMRVRIDDGRIVLLVHFFPTKACAALLGALQLTTPNAIVQAVEVERPHMPFLIPIFQVDVSTQSLRELNAMLT
jgi:hypothetical protein